MTRQDALKRLNKIFGKKLGYRVDPTAPSPEERAEAKERLAALTEARQQAEAACLARKKELLLDPEYQRLQAALQAAKKAADESFSKLHHFKFTVGECNGMFFSVKAQGDNWEEIFAKLATPRTPGG